MAFLQKIFKRKQSNCKTEKSRSLTLTEEPTGSGSISTTNLSEDSSISSSVSSDGSDNEVYSKQMQKLIRQKRRLDTKVDRKCEAVVLMQAEVTQLMKLISRSKHQMESLDEELLNKQCEMKYLRTKFPEGCEMEAKKREPLIYKRFTNIKTSSDARSLLNNIRQRQRALGQLELLTSNKYLELSHRLKSTSVKKRNSLLMKDKVRNFGHLVDVMSERDTDGRSPKRSGSEPKQTSQSPTGHLTTVDVSIMAAPPSMLTAQTSDTAESERGSLLTSSQNNVTATPPQALLFSSLFGIPSSLSQATETAL